MRQLTLLIVIVLGALVLIPNALAVKPVKETTVSGGFLVDEDSCGFPVLVEPRHDRLRLFTFSDGRELLTASYLATATNLESGKSVKVNLSGQAVFKVSSDGTSAFRTTGATLLIDPGTLTLVHGPIVFSFDADGTFLGRTVISSSTRDMCAALSDS